MGDAITSSRCCIAILYDLLHYASAADHTDACIVEWWVPPIGKKADFQKGRKKDIVDIFGQWRPFSELIVKEAGEVDMPPVVVPVADVLEYNFDLEEGKIPFKVLDALRTTHGIDTTALSVSRTALGNVYRAYVLMHL